MQTQSDISVEEKHLGILGENLEAVSCGMCHNLQQYALYAQSACIHENPHDAPTHAVQLSVHLSFWRQRRFPCRYQDLTCSLAALQGPGSLLCQEMSWTLSLGTISTTRSMWSHQGQKQTAQKWQNLARPSYTNGLLAIRCASACTFQVLR